MKKILTVVGIVVIIIITFLLYARFIGTKGLKVNEYKVSHSNITDNYHGLKIVQISDIHYGSTVFENELNTIINKVNELKPDIVVLTGDLIDDKNSYTKQVIAEILSKINADLGKFAVSGNHDLMEDYKDILNISEFKLLDNGYELIYKENKPIIISGLSSSYSEDEISYKTESFDKYVSTAIEKPIYSILLLHEPDFVDKINVDNYNLILAGHSHGGQVVLPIITNNILPIGAKKYYKEYYKINNTDLYINNGIGTSKMKLRLFAKPSINFYRITK